MSTSITGIPLVSGVMVNSTHALPQEQNFGLEQGLLLAQKADSKYGQYVEASFRKISPPSPRLEQGLLSFFVGSTSGGSERSRTTGERAFDFMRPLDRATLNELPVPTQNNMQANASAKHYSELTDTQKYFWDKWTAHEFDGLEAGSYGDKEFTDLLNQGLYYLVNVLAP